MLVETNNVTDMFPEYVWGMDNLTSYCKERWGATPDPEWTRTYFGGSATDPARPFRDTGKHHTFIYCTHT